MAAELRIIASMAPRRILAEIVATHSKATGDRITLTAVGGVEAARRVCAGETFDMVVLAAEALAKLAVEGHVVADTIHVIAVSPTAVAVRTGAPAPQRLDDASLKSLVQSARAIGVSSGPSGVAVRKLHSRWSSPAHIVEAAPGAPVAHLIARGEVDVGFQQWSEFIDEPGIAIVGPVPGALLPKTAFSAALSHVVSDPLMASRVLNVLTAATADAIKRRHGMEPPSA